MRVSDTLQCWIGIVALLSLVVCNITGCQGMPSTSQGTVINGFAFNTTYRLTIYDQSKDAQKILESCIPMCTRYERIFSTKLEDSELYKVNQLEQIYLKLYQKTKCGVAKEDITYFQKQMSVRIKQSGMKDVPEYHFDGEGGLRVKVSSDLAALVEKGLYYSKLSQGRFDITINPVSSQWNFADENPEVPEQSSIQDALSYVDYKKVFIKGHNLHFQIPGMGIDLGGIAKGYIADQLKSYLLEQGVTSGMINLGGNILCIGEKMDGSPFQIGIQQPFADRNETIAAIKAKDVSVVSSGIYERYFKTEDGSMYHHILDPRTGYSYQNDLLGVSIVSDASVDGDGLSTTAFALGLDKGLELINATEGVEAVFITSDEKLHYSSGFEKMQ